MHTIEAANSMLNRMDRSDTLYCDIESTGLNAKGGVDHAMGIAIADEHGQSAYLPFQHPTGGNLHKEYLYDTVVPFLNKQRRTLVWHNLKADYQFKHTWGIDMRMWQCRQEDTMLGMYLLNEEFPSYELDYLGNRLLGKGKIDKVVEFGKTFGFNEITPSMMDEYARNDVATLTRGIHGPIKSELAKREQLDLWHFKTGFAMHLGEMERRGVGVNADFCEQMAARGERAMEIIENKLGFNPASPIELGDYLVGYLQLPVMKRGKPNKQYPEGRPSFDKEVMAKYEDMLEGVNDESARLILDYRGWQKAVSSLYLPALSKRDPDGRIRTEFRQARTSTGRLASANPNLQQIPRWTEKPWNGEAKKAFWSGYEDFDLIGYDYSQLELRMAAAYGEDEKLLGVFERGEDPFAMFAISLFGEFTPENRYRAKNCFIYPMNYGAGRGKIKGLLGYTSWDDVNAIYDKYQAEHPGLYTASKETERRAKSRGYIKYWTGRRRHCRNEKYAHKMWNSLMQGGAAELVERSMMRAPNDENCFQVLQVHDEIVWCIRKGMRHIYEPEIIKAMTDWRHIFNVKLAVDGHLWNEDK